MTIRAFIIGDSDVVLWGLSSRERLERQIAAVPELVLAGSVEELVATDTGAALLLRADYLFEVRTLTALLERQGLLMDGETAAAAHVAGGAAAQALAALDGDTAAQAGFEQFEVAALQTYEGKLRRTDLPTLAPIREAEAEALANRLYGSAYKGITDLVTKFWWPKPAKRVVAWCAERRITPNMVTLTGLVLMLAAGWCFYQGMFLIGLAFGWIMTFLDTVDGKLARVTVKSSRAGHLLDHGMDIVHPPFWYWLWGLGLAVPPALWGFDATALYILIFVGYIAGRLAEGAFSMLGELEVFTWRPFDAYFRLVAGRRNPSLILLTGFTLLGSPEWAFLSVVIWTVLSTLILWVRFFQGLSVRQHTGEPLRSWMADPQAAAVAHPQAFRTFSTTRSAYGDG